MKERNFNTKIGICIKSSSCFVIHHTISQLCFLKLMGLLRRQLQVRNNFIEVFTFKNLLYFIQYPRLHRIFFWMFETDFCLHKLKVLRDFNTFSAVNCMEWFVSCFGQFFLLGEFLSKFSNICNILYWLYVHNGQHIGSLE